MREISYILLAVLITWPAIYFAIPVAGFDIETWVLILSASIGGIFSGLVVLLGETVIEDIVKIVILLCLAGILWGSTPKLGFIFITALAGVAGAIINQINQYAANKRTQSDQHTATQFGGR
jgi:glucose uptake protein GlcU